MGNKYMDVPVLAIGICSPRLFFCDGDPASARHGIKISIWNGDDSPSGDFDVRFHCVNYPSSALGMETKVFTSLAAQQVHKFVYPDPSCDAWKTGQYTHEVVVDPEINISDDFRGDNTRTLPFQVLPKIKKHRLSLQEPGLAQEMGDYL